MEKLIYIHVARLGDSLNRKKGMFSGYDDATNDWYVIKQRGEGRGDRVQISRVFEGASRVFEGAGQLNRSHLALLDTDCVVIGSLLYVIGGCCLLCDSCNYNCRYLRYREIRCLDTRNPQDGWRTCFTLPFRSCVPVSTVVDSQWLYLFPFKETCCYGFNIEDGKSVQTLPKPSNCKSVQTLPKPSNCTSSPCFSTSLSPGTLVAYERRENTLYQLDCKNSAWTVYHKDFLPYSYKELLGSSFAVDDDGILYIYLRVYIRLISFDIRNKKELHAVDLPRSFWYGLEEDYVELIVLSKNKFCLLWDGLGTNINQRRIYYSRFSVSYDDLDDPIVDGEETRSFLVAGYEVLNVVIVDPPEDVGSSRVDVSGGGEKPK
ncbi:hypothetical protein QN277_026965 [Acacia crassicarpa]|uniref:F-box protein n=1 Tax=Acacia crassicarpa TaxID=499986 RepID=A0AAE1MFV5_9FABA|nr:hypothetical protein QN277_026965 [Acacia crassicarpa]